ncbi:MATE family efflux transporter [Porphyromonas sp. HMSC065F10]|uniref:MATE family efflux transporter n=1 Tax=Porphyromonas sp. HMSC065F10 TaxID=1739394 RepID=UPI0008A2F819|nr:MATE family efflux transporter [Porphyromonas sp. HMSC065F10]OFR40233.1 MATE family efflux transporter [Porphyromonas sp. HMSC065F10]
MSSAAGSSLDRRILKLALPNIVSNLTVPLLGLVDMGLTGHLEDAAPIAGISIATTLFNLIYWVFSFLRMGTSGLTAQAYGSRSRERMGRTLAQSFLIGLVGGLLIILLQTPLSRMILSVLAPEAEVERYALIYFAIVVMGAPAILTTNAMNGWFIGMQNSWYPMAVSIVTNLTNIGLSAFLVLSEGQGIEGIAIGTLVSQWLGMLLLAAGVLLLYVRRGRVVLPHRLSALGEELGRYFSTNVHIFFRTLLMACVSVYFVYAGTRMGTLTLAGNALLYQFFTLFSYFIDGFANAGEAIVGDAYGQRSREEVRTAVRRLLGWGIGLGLVVTAIYAVVGGELLALLTDREEVLQQALLYLPYVVVIPLAGCIGFVMDGVFIGMTATREMMWSMLAAVVLFFVVDFGLPLEDGNARLMTAFLLYLAARGFVQLLIGLRLEGLGVPFSHHYIILAGTTYNEDRARSLRELILEALPEARLTEAMTSEDAKGSGRLYRNALLILDSREEPDVVARRMKELEERAGRVHTSGGEVALDLDVVLCDDRVLRPTDYAAPYFQSLYHRLNTQ